MKPTPCHKRAYATKEEARSFLVPLWRKAKKGEKSKLPRRAYQCLRCGFWHLTSQEKHSLGEPRKEI